MATKTVYFVRHGESKHNSGDITQYLQNSPISPLGREQARKIAERAKHLSVDIVLSSHLSRAHDTAVEIATAIGKKVEISELFMERRIPSEAEGKNIGDPETQILMEAWEK